MKNILVRVCKMAANNFEIIFFIDLNLYANLPGDF